MYICMNVASSTEVSHTSNAVSTSSSIWNPYELPAPKHILYPVANVKIGWNATSHSWEVGAGMMNVGNTCYLNATLQALFHVPSMANWLMSDTIYMACCESTEFLCAICAMSKTLLDSQNSQTPIKPYRIYTKLKSICKNLQMGRQEDAHEFLRYLVEAMEKSYLLRFSHFKDLDQYSKETTPLNQILGGYLKSSVRCLECGHHSVTFQHFQDILLDIRKADSVEEALEGYFSLEPLEDMGYKCEGCKKKVSATKKFSLERAPIVLCIQLKRFSMLGHKLNKQITIKPRLNITKYSSRQYPNRQLNYRLVAMITHLGATQNGGHYTAVGLTQSGTYYNFDDSSVRPISIQNVCNTNAYIIFYEIDAQMSRRDSSNTSREVSGTLGGSTSSIMPLAELYRINESPTGSENFGPKVVHEYTENLPGSTVLANSVSKLMSNRNSTLIPSCSSSSLSKPSNGGCSKLTIHFKHNSISTNASKTTAVTSSIISASATLSTSTFNNLKNDSININNTKTSCISNGLHLAGTSKYQETASSKFTLGVSTTRKQVNDKNCNESSSDDDDKNEIVSSSTSSQTVLQATLPSMPKLGVESLNSTTNLTNGLSKKSPAPIKSLVPYGSETDDEIDVCVTATITNANTSCEQQRNVSPNSLKRRHSSSSWSSRSSSDNDNANDKGAKPSHNIKIKKATTSTMSVNSINTLKSPTKSSDAGVKKSSESIDEIFNSIKRSNTINTINSTSSISLQKKKSQNQQFKVTSSTTTADTFSSDSDGESNKTKVSSNAKNLLKKSHPTPPSPPVVKTNSGIWQVTSLQSVTPSINQTNSSPSSASSAAAVAVPKNPKNPFTTKPSLANDNAKRLKKETSNNKSFNGNGYQRNSGNESALSELLKQSHRGYGSPILTWNGQQSEIDKEIISDAREQRQRDWEDEDATEMDRGRQKQVKALKDPYTPTRTSGYNPFQEQENQKRWKRYPYVGGGGGCYRHNFQRNKFKFQRFQHKFSKKNMIGGSGNSILNMNRRNDS